MVRNLLTVVVLLFAVNLTVFAQSGALKGKVIDKSTKEPIPFTNIVVENNGTLAGGTTSDIDGNYTIKPIAPGKYDIKASFVGYKPVLIRGFVVRADKIEFQNIEMEPTATQLETYEVIDYKVPLISKDNTVQGGTVTSEEIAKMPSRNATAIASTVSGVFSRDGEVGSIRGQRTDGNVMYIDGIRVRGSGSLPESAIEQVSVILGGVPAQYGDATGGIINVTTKGPSRRFGGGLELQTSEFLDPYGQSRVGLNLTGPLLWNKEKTSSILGYFLATDFFYNKDGSPLPLGVWKANDSTQAALEANPLRRSNSGFGSFQNVEFVRKSNLVELKSTQNTSNYSMNSSLKIDVKAAKNTNLTIGGSFNINGGRGFSWTNSIFNSDRNGFSTSNTWRTFVRFTQRFPADKESTSLIKNVYYSIQGDYTKYSAKYMDADLKDNLFGYGYIGKFSTYKIKNYEDITDTLGLTVGREMIGYQDTLVKFDRFELNPVMANYTSNYYSLYNSTAFHYDNYESIFSGGGLLNGYTPNGMFGGVYGMWSAPGNPQSGYGENYQDQISANFNISGDVGNHELKLGFIFEQTRSGGYSYNPTAFWPIMYQLANSHIIQLDLSDPISSKYIDEFGDTLTQIDYHRLYDAASQRYFDKNLRKQLGLNENGTDWIDVNSYDINAHTINYYDENNVPHTITLSKPLSVELFSPDELLNNGNSIASARGYDYYGNKFAFGYKPSVEDFYKPDANGYYKREIAPYQPIYMAGYIQDKFSFEDLVFNVGLRVDRFDANQSVLADPYSLYPAKTVKETSGLGNIPSSMGPDYVVYVDNINNPTRITGYRNGSTWYDRDGSVVLDPIALDAGNGILPYIEPKDLEISGKSFTDYKPQYTVMPRISFSFPISDEALFYAHYDVLTQRPKSNVVFDPTDYLYWASQGNPTMNNPNLKPERTVDYELGFQQKVSNTSSINISAFYREFRDQIQSFRYTGAYPKTYYSYSNIDFGTVKGLTLSYDLRRTANARIRAGYTLQFANGTGSNAETSSGLIRSGQPNLRTLIPYDYDRRHALNINVDYRYGEGKDYNGPILANSKVLENTGFNLTINGGSGTPYTRSSKISPLGAQNIIQGSINGSRLPWSFRLDGRVDKDFTLGRGKDKGGNVKMYYLNVYLQVLNILNSKNIMNVYSATGNPDDDGYLAAAEYQAQISAQLDTQSYIDFYRIRVNNPYNYSSPRMIRVGLGLSF